MEKKMQSMYGLYKNNRNDRVGIFAARPRTVPRADIPPKRVPQAETRARRRACDEQLSGAVGRGLFVGGLGPMDLLMLIFDNCTSS